jgi:hypothetical protein
LRAYRLAYLDELPGRAPAANGASLPSEVRLIGYDDDDHPHEEVPPLQFAYTTFSVDRRQLRTIEESCPKDRSPAPTTKLPT